MKSFDRSFIPFCLNYVTSKANIKIEDQTSVESRQENTFNMYSEFFEKGKTETFLHILQVTVYGFKTSKAKQM